jgi:hypothetical protein
MSTIGKRVIYVGGAGDNNSTPRNVEGEAVSAVLPGTLLAESASGLDASAASATTTSQLPLFADKDQLKSKSVDDAWTINQNMVAILGRSGDFLNVLVATGQTLSIGEALVSNGAGLLIAATDVVDDAGGSQHIICYSDEALTTSGTTLVRVRIA